MPPTIDPLQLAQFMILPGAAELVEAFSSLPPGDIRDSVVSHAQVLARAAGWSPPIPFAMEPTGRAPSLPGPKRLLSPYAEGLTSQSQEGQIIERLMRGEADHVVADDLGVPLGAIVRLKRKAAREGGLEFPGGDAKSAKQAKADQGKKGRKLNLGKMPVPDPPYWWEDPNSPVWKNGRLLPAFSETGEGTMAALGPLDYRNWRVMNDAAARHGQTLRQYIAQRLEILRRVEAGEVPTAVALDLRISPYVIYALLTKVGRGRMTTLEEGARAAKSTAEPPQAVPQPKPAPAAPRKAPAGNPSAADPRTLSLRKRAAEMWGFASLESYEQMRQQVIDLRLSGKARLDIVRELDMPLAFVKSVVQTYRKRGGAGFPVAYAKRKVA